MKVVMTSTTNARFNDLLGVEGNLSIDDLFFRFDFRDADFMPPFDLRHGHMRSSIIKTVTQVETNRLYYTITIITTFSTYVFTHGKKNNKPPIAGLNVL
ncbi:MAG: hypothetical protein U9Q38_06360 [Thermodesulfobacteriota bacterium]|nr:hypothetical protein [Thermodesulfobacteriota bacterium]